MICSSVESLFYSLVEYNHQQVKLYGNKQIPMSNVYFISILNHSDSFISKAFDYLFDAEKTNPFSTVKTNINFDEEQFYFVDLLKDSIPILKNKFESLVQLSKESEASNVLILDIGFLFDLLKLFNQEKLEVHLYDFILYQLQKSIDTIIILDSEGILESNNKKSSVYYELKLYLLKKLDEDFHCPLSQVSLYKNYNHLYWNINTNKNKEKNIEFMENVPIKKLCFSNLFKSHDVVLNPIDKLLIYY